MGMGGGKGGPPIPNTSSDVPDRRQLSFWRQISALRRATPTWFGLILGAVALAITAALWAILTAGEPESRFFNPLAVPSPGEAWDNLGPLYDRDLIGGIMASLKRVVLGFGLATVVGVLTGVIAASFRPFEAFMRPLVLFGRSVPIAALIPLMVVLFGIEDQGKILFLYVAIVPFVFSDTVAAVLTIPERYVDTARTLGASRFQIIRKVLVPLAAPDIVTGLRFLFGLSFGYIMLAEAIAAKSGLGFMIMISRRLSKPEHVFILLIVIALLAYIIDRLLLELQRGFFPYRSDL